MGSVIDAERVTRWRPVVSDNITNLFYLLFC